MQRGRRWRQVLPCQWVVARTLAWPNRFRRLMLRYERRDDIHQEERQVGCALIGWHALQRWS